MTRSIDLENIGPIDHLTIPLPEAGVVVLRGRNGVGKSHALAAVDSLVSGRGRPTCRDNAVRGVVEGFGARLTIGRSQRRTGEAEVVTLEGRLDISQLVQPPIKDPAAADAARIKALIQLSGAVADGRRFEELLPNGLELSDLVSASEQAEDAVALAGRVKRALEAEARRAEREAEGFAAEIAVLTRETGDLGQSSEDEALVARIRHQPDVVRAEAECRVAEAMAALREVETRRQMAAQEAERVAVAREKLAVLESQESISTAAIAAEIVEVEAAIRQMEHDLAVARERREQLVLRREAAEKLEKQVASLRATVNREVRTVSDAELAAAQDALLSARFTLDRILVLTQQVRVANRLEGLRARYEEAVGSAQMLRDAAQGVDQVLSDLVGAVTNRLRVEADRLVCDTHRGAEPFAELSPGERWRIALEIAAEQVGRGGLVTVPQEAWEGLDPVHRAEVAEIARQVGVVILTAEADASEQITAEVV